MRWLINSLLIVFLMSLVIYPLPVGKFSVFAKSSLQEGGTPKILYAQWRGKNLSIEGIGFTDGTAVFIDGQKLKSILDPVYPNNFLTAKKAKKKVAPDQAIKIQVQNPSGELSNEFLFYSGFVITSDYHGSIIDLKVGDNFLLFLPPKGNPPTLEWGIGTGSTDPPPLVHTMDNLPIPHTQGFFQAVRPGQFIIDGEGRYLCPPMPPEFCGPLGYHIGFNLIVRVE
jgi:hypothetical protein